MIVGGVVVTVVEVFFGLGKSDLGSFLYTFCRHFQVSISWEKKKKKNSEKTLKSSSEKFRKKQQLFTGFKKRK